MEKKIAYIGKPTYKRLIKRLNLSELEILEEISLLNGKIVYKVKSLNSSLNTKEERFIYNNDMGEFYISDGIKDINKVKLTKVLKGLWNICNPQSLSELNKKWKNYYSNISSIKISEILSEIYNMEHFESENATISNSCMQGKGEFYQWLDDDKNVKIAYLIDDDGILIGRAILWFNVKAVYEDGNGNEIMKTINFMDRIYSKNDYIEELFKKWAKVNNFYFKRKQSYDNKKDIISPSGEIIYDVYLEFELENKLTGTEEAPYMDTFSYLNGLKYLNNSHGERILTNTDGSGIYNVVSCYHCGDLYRENDDDLYYSEYFDRHICSYCLEHYYVYCEDINDYAYCDDAYYCESDGNYYYHDDNLVYLDDGYYHIDDCFKCFHCDEWCLIDNGFQVISINRGNFIITEVCDYCFTHCYVDVDVIKMADDIRDILTTYYRIAGISEDILETDDNDDYILPENLKSEILAKKLQ